MTRPIRVEKQRTIRASPQRVYQLLSRVEGLPRFADLWLVADVLERGGGQVVAEFRGYFGGLPVDSVQRFSLRPPVRLEFRQVRGTLKAFRGEYVIEPEGSGTRVTARLEVEAGIPLLSEPSVRMVLTNSLERMLSKVKDAAERDLPRLVPAKRTALSAAARPEAVEAVEPADAAEEPVPTEVEAPAPPPVVSAPASSMETRRPGRRRRRRRHRRRPGAAPPHRPGPPAPP